jgi:hypothetical protein
MLGVLPQNLISSLYAWEGSARHDEKGAADSNLSCIVCPHSCARPFERAIALSHLVVGAWFIKPYSPELGIDS